MGLEIFILRGLIDKSLIVVIISIIKSKLDWALNIFKFKPFFTHAIHFESIQPWARG